MSDSPSVFWSVPVIELLGRLRSTPKGLSGEEARQRLARLGANLLKPRKKTEAITLLEVYRAVGDGPLFRLHASPPNPHCHVARGLKPALGRVYGALGRRSASCWPTPSTTEKECSATRPPDVAALRIRSCKKPGKMPYSIP